MAKLNPDAQEAAAAVESSFTPLEPGAYHAKLRDVDTSRSGPAGPYWSWEFEVIDEPYVGRRLWNNTSLSAKAAFKVQETFDAFGVPLDTDTDDMIGQVVKLQVTIRTIQEGTRKGEETNQVDRLKPADQDVLDRVAAEDEAKKEMEKIF